MPKLVFTSVGMNRFKAEVPGLYVYVERAASEEWLTYIEYESTGHGILETEEVSKSKEAATSPDVPKTFLRDEIARLQAILDLLDTP